jgi:hypothetical protein
MNRNYRASIFYDGSADFTKTVQKYEDLGLAGLAVPQVYGSPFDPLAAAATVTKRVQWGLGPEQYAAKTAAIAETFWPA